MRIRKLASVVPVVAVLALAAPVASASAQTGPSAIPCYPYPAFCGPTGQPWFSFLPFQLPGLTLPFHFGLGPAAGR